jgi:GTPase SAR1 family protein
MLPKLFEAIPRKSYNNLGHVVLLLFFLCGVTIISITNDYDANTNLTCNPSKEITSSHDFVELTCFSKYKATYHWRISFGMLVVFNFALILTFSVLYASWAQPRVEKWNVIVQQCNDGTADNNKDISLFCIYTSHLLLTRFVLLLLFAAVIFYPINFPTNFSCPWRHPPNNIPCVNIMAAKKMNLAKAVAIIDVVFALFALVEVTYLLYIFWWKRRNEEFCVFDDMEFCSVYILQRRGNIGSIINKIRDSPREDTNFFIKLMIQENRRDEDGQQMHEIYDIPLCKRKHRINNIEDIFKPIKNQSTETPRRILIVGRPGIGKTALTKRILQKWKCKTVDFWKGKLVIRFAFRTFNHEENQKLSLSILLSYGDGVTPAASGERLQDLYQFINLNQKKVILVFDGLDELDVDLERCWQEEEDTLNETELNMSIFSLYVKLIRRNFFPEATIVTTTRRTAEKIYRHLNFDKKLEILGFTKAEIKDYVMKCPQYRKISQEIWGIIKQSAELLSICYIPVSCEIVCSTLKESIPFQKQGSVAHTITEIYRRYITTMLYKHHKLFKEKRKGKDYILPETELPDQLKNDLSRLAKIAKLALDDKWNLVFKLDKDSSNLEDCGLLVKKEDTNYNLYSFPHLTIQEYLAAVHILHDVDTDMADFLSSNIKVARWHLVIQFLAGLIGNEIRLLRGKELEMDELSRRKKALLVKIVYDG